MRVWDERHGRLGRKETTEGACKRSAKGRKSPEDRRKQRSGSEEATEQRCEGTEPGKRRDERMEKAQAVSESESQVPVRAEEMKQSLRPGKGKTGTGERDGSKV